MNKNRKKFFLKYIIKINDREINKKTASGFTTWALLGFLGLLFYKVLNHLPIFLNNYNLINIIFANIFNFIIILFTIFNYLVVYTLINGERKLLPNLFSKWTIPLKLINYLTLLLGVLINFRIAINYNLLSAISYYLFSLYIFLVFLSLYLFINKKNQLLKNGYPTIQWPNFDNKSKTKLKIIGIIHILVLFIIFYFCQAQIINKDFLINNILLIKIAIYFMVIIGLFIILAIKYSTYIKNDWLESFEKRIILNNYTYEQIKDEFMQEYSGISIKLWLKQLEEEVGKKRKTLKKHIEEFKNNYKDIKVEHNLEKYDLNEIKERIHNNNKYYEKINKSHEEFQKIFRRKNEDLNKFISQGPFSEEEIFLLKMTKSKLNSYFNSLENDLKIQGEKFKNDKKNIELLLEKMPYLKEERLFDVKNNQDFT